jgi:hypothetical protein
MFISHIIDSLNMNPEGRSPPSPPLKIRSRVVCVEFIISVYINANSGVF